MQEDKPKTIAEEAGLPENWVPKDVAPIIPSAPAIDQQQGPGQYFAGPLSSNLQHDAAFYKTRYGGSGAPEFPLMPLAPSGNASINSAVKSIVAVGGAGGSGGGTAQNVSITLTAPAEINVAGSPADATGEFDLTWASENPFTVFAGPVGDQNGTFDASAAANGISTTAAVSIASGPSLFAMAFVTQEFPTITAPGTPAGFTIFDNTLAGQGAGIYLQSPASTGTIPVVSGVAGPNLGWLASIALFGAKTSVTPTIVQQIQITGGNINTPPQFSASQSFVSNNTAGNMILVFANAPEIYHPGGKAAPASMGVFDSNGNSYAQIINNSFATYDNLGNLQNSVQHIVFVALDVIAGSNTVTVQVGAGGMTGNSSVEMYEINGLGAGPGTPHFRPLTSRDLPPPQISNLIGIVPVSGGGTGTGTLTNHGVVIGRTTSAVAVTAAGSVGQILTSNGASADPTFNYPFTSNNTAIATNIGVTNLVAGPPPTGLYRVSVYEEINSGTLPTLQTNIQWTDDSGAQSATPAGTGFSTVGGFAQGSIVIRVASGNITFSTTTTGTINYNTLLRAEYLGP